MKDMNAKWNKYARTGIAAYVILHRKRAGDGENRKVIVGSAQPFGRQVAESMVQSARENAEPRTCRQERRKTCSHVLYYSCVCPRGEVLDLRGTERTEFDGL